MKTNYLNLDRILDLEKWQVLQDSLAQVTGLAIITVDYKGVPITRHSGRRPFCNRIRNEPALERYCHKCDSRGGLEAVRINAPYIYLCHCNVVDMAIPITVDDKYVGAIMAGEVRLPSNDPQTCLEHIFSSPTPELLDSPEMRALYEAMPVLHYHKLEIIAHMLYNLSQYIVQESMSKNLIFETYEKLWQLKEPALHGMSLPDSNTYSLVNLETLKRELSHVVTNTYIKTAESSQHTCKNLLLKPAFDYIRQNSSERITQKTMANLCHISVSHFSRLFSRETGDSFSGYLSRQKVELSKQLLEKTDLSVTQISNELGYSYPGYFIKTFKKYENLTPTLYRKYYSSPAP